MTLLAWLPVDLTADSVPPYAQSHLSFWLGSLSSESDYKTFIELSDILIRNCKVPSIKWSNQFEKLVIDININKYFLLLKMWVSLMVFIQQELIYILDNRCTCRAHFLFEIKAMLTWIFFLKTHYKSDLVGLSASIFSSHCLSISGYRPSSPDL